MEKIKCYCGHTGYCDCVPLELPARTAMQELIDELKRVKSMTNMNFVIRIANDLLEKDKECIVNAFEAGYKSCDIDEAFEINKKLASGEQYYNQTYNK